MIARCIYCGVEGYCRERCDQHSFRVLDGWVCPRCSDRHGARCPDGHKLRDTMFDRIRWVTDDNDRKKPD